VCAVATRLSSTDSADYASLFSNGSPIEKLPPRFGYYVGYLVATEAASSGRSLSSRIWRTKMPGIW
jgi:hypothetical protein